MKTLIATAAAATALVMAGPALADDHTSSDGWEVVERNDRGHATKVRRDGNTLDVCMNERQDNCIQPREAGLGWGDRPLDYWPGHTTSR